MPSISPPCTSSPSSSSSSSSPHQNELHNLNGIEGTGRGSCASVVLNGGSSDKIAQQQTSSVRYVPCSIIKCGGEQLSPSSASVAAMGSQDNERRSHITRVPSSALLSLLPDDDHHLCYPTANTPQPATETMALGELTALKDDPGLLPYSQVIMKRASMFASVKQRLNAYHGGLINFAKGYKLFGYNRVIRPNGSTGWLYREWLPAAKEVRLMGDFNGWSKDSHPLTNQPDTLLHCTKILSTCGGPPTDPPGNVCFERSLFEDTEDKRGEASSVWWIYIQDNDDGTWRLHHRCKVRIYVLGEDHQWFDRVPAWSRLAWQNPETQMFDGVVWCPEYPYVFKHPLIHPSTYAISHNTCLRIYEAHVGISQLEDKVGTYKDFTNNLLKRIKLLGYNALLLVAILEHPCYGSFGFHVSNYLAPSSRFGTPEELKELVDSAHGLGMRVLFSLPHSHASSNVLDGLSQIDGSHGAYVIDGDRGTHQAWDARVFDFQKTEVLRYMLSSIAWLAEEYRVDGFRFEGVTSMLFNNHAIWRNFSGDYDEYFGNPRDLDEYSFIYLMLSNELLHSLPDVPSGGSPRCLSIAMDWSGIPTLARPISEGGVGFDYNYRVDLPSKWTSLLRKASDFDWSLSSVVWPLAQRRVKERCIAAAEDSDTSRIGRRQLKIAMFSWESLHTHAVGGVAPHVTELAAGLNRLGHEIHVFVRAIKSANSYAVHYGVHYHECTFNLNSDFVAEMENMCHSFVSSMKSTESMMGEAFDVVHAHDWLAAKALVQCNGLGRKCVMTMHSTEFGRCGNNSYGGMSKRIRDVEGEACSVAHRVICVSGVLAEEVQHQYSVNQDKLKAIYNGIHCTHFDGFEDAGSVKSSYGIGVMEPMFLFVGRLVIQKGPDLMIEAIPHILKFRGDVKFVIVGDGHMRHELEGRANHLGVGHAVRFVGKKTGGELKSLFKACDAVLVPSRNEPFGIVVLEGWSAWKPVIATTCGGPRDFVTPNVDGVLVVGHCAIYTCVGSCLYHTHQCLYTCVLTTYT
eukprot:GHVQ01040468.1.p1 GENE.GHVQ01040468.1~~GHVQ01040468.1.p1  ORF type:complete len:1022 (-),score=152.14 GHVQ01040468.1:1478-4543(-)